RPDPREEDLDEQRLDRLERIEERDPRERRRHVDPNEVARTPQQADDAGGASGQRDRKEDDGAERERDDADEEWAQLLKHTREIDVANGGQRGEGERREKATSFPVPRSCRRSVHHGATGIRATPRWRVESAQARPELANAGQRGLDAAGIEAAP